MEKNINPKSLKGKDKLNRIKNLMGRMNTLNESNTISELDLIKKGPNGVIYGIIRENHKYFIKTTEKKSGNLLSEDFNYIGGLQNKFSEAYDSYAEATKQLNLKFDMLNESFGIESNNNIFESDGIAFAGGTGFGFVVEDEEEEEEVLTDNEEDIVDEQDEKKVLKVPAPETPTSELPATEEPMEDEVLDDTNIEEPMSDMSTEEPVDDGGDDETDPTKKIQKMTGKIGQMLRDMEEPDVDLEKYVINSIISALHLDKFSGDDVDDVVSKLEGEDEKDDMESELTGGEEAPEEPAMETEPTEEPAMTEESFKFKKGDLLESMTKKILKKRINEGDDYGRLKPSPKSIRDKVRKRRGELKGNQHKLDVAKPFGKLTSADFKKLRGESMDMMDEHHYMDINEPDTYGKYDKDEYIISDYIDCPHCVGMGCPHCNGMGYHLSSELENDMDNFDSEPSTERLGYDGIDDDFMTIDGQTGEYGPFDRDGDEIPASIDLDDDNDGQLDEMHGDGYGLSVMDSISGTVDRDRDGIPADIDNVYGDGEDELDIRFFSKPTTKPAPTKPTTKPGTRPKDPMWNPNKNPQPQTTPKAVEEGSKKGRTFRKKGWYK